MPFGQNLPPPAESGPSSPALPVADNAAPPRDAHCHICLGHEDHDEWNAQARGETPLQRVDRAYGEILQEVRVAQTGVQILFAFLLALAFTTRFATVTSFQRGLYVLTLLLCAGAAALLIAPAAYHRVIYRRRMKQHLVRVANRLALSGLLMLLLAIISALLLILDVTLGFGLALLLGTGALAWFVTWWFGLPIWTRLCHGSQDDAGEPGRPAERPDDSVPFSGPHAAGVNLMSEVGPSARGRRVRSRTQ